MVINKILVRMIIHTMDCGIDIKKYVVSLDNIQIEHTVALHRQSFHHCLLS